MLEIFHENSLRVWEEFYFPIHPKTFHGCHYYYKTCNNITHLWLSKVYMTVSWCWCQHIDSSFTAFKVGCKSEKPTSQKNFGEEYTSHGNSLFMRLEYWIVVAKCVAIRSRMSSKDEWLAFITWLFHSLWSRTTWTSRSWVANLSCQNPTHSHHWKVVSTFRCLYDWMCISRILLCVFAC